jgi:hypothetical protein
MSDDKVKEKKTRQDVLDVERKRQTLFDFRKPRSEKEKHQESDVPPPPIILDAPSEEIEVIGNFNITTSKGQTSVKNPKIFVDSGGHTWLMIAGLTKKTKTFINWKAILELEGDEKESKHFLNVLRAPGLDHTPKTTCADDHSTLNLITPPPTPTIKKAKAKKTKKDKLVAPIKNKTEVLP